MLMPSTPSAYPQVASCPFASFRVIKSIISAAQAVLCAWFGSGSSTKTADQRAPAGPHDPVVDEALDARPTPVPHVFPYVWCDRTPAPAHDAQPNQVKTSLRVTVWRLRLRMISSSWPKQWVMVGRLAWPTTICWGRNDLFAAAMRPASLIRPESPMSLLHKVMVG